MKNNRRVKVAVLGAGVIGTAICKCLIANGFEVIATRRKLDKAQTLIDMGVKVISDNNRAAAEADLIFFTVKPFQVIPLAFQTSESIQGKICISMAAGLELSLLCEVMPEVKWVRGMTNTCTMVQKGFTVYVPSKKLLQPDLELLEEIFKTMGLVEKVEERFMDPLTAMSGSGPAYIYTVIEALTYGGLRVGIPRDLACKAAAATAIGASELLLAADEHPAELRDQVVTPGGTTIEGIYELEDAQIRTAFMRAISAATERGHELAQEIRKQALEQIRQGQDTDRS